MDVTGGHVSLLYATGIRLVEAGFTRTKNTANILMKNLLDFMLGSILFWAIGFGIMFGPGDSWECLTFSISTFMTRNYRSRDS